MKRALVVAVLAAGCSAAEAGAPGVLERYCARCHTGPRAEGDLDFILDPQRLIAAGLIVPGDAARSVIWRRLEAGEMPPASVARRPTPSEVAALRTWIDGMPDHAVFRRDPAELARILAADAVKLSPRARASARWLTLEHLARGGVPPAQLERYRVALEIALASLTWSPSPRPVVVVDPERTVFRIDLRELGWSDATWDAIRAQYPYGVARGAGVPDAIRADWFVATATRAPLYHAILGIPDTEAELARRLGVELDGGVVARSGFTNSGVSVNNRVIERHPTRHGALWRSYDFRTSVDRENVFAHPLDFVPAGGELIFNLPNGFQAYMLVDGTGRRLDKAPTAIVSDPRRPDRAVETALSCIGCHASGIIDRADQVREAVRGLDDAVRARVLQLHPPADELARLFAQDRARFTAALARIGYTPTGDEPVNQLTARYEADVDLALAAAELGVAPGELEARFARSPELRRTLGAFATGGAVKRDSWAQLFPRVLRELGLGVPFTPAGGGDRGPAVWVDRAHRTWIAVAAGVDQAGAAAACERRGFELPRPTDLVAAVAGGLAGAIALPRPLWTAGARLDASNQRFASVVDPFTGTTRRAEVASVHDVVCVQ